MWSIKNKSKPNSSDIAKRHFKTGLGLVIPKFRAPIDSEPMSKLFHTFKSGLESNLHSLSLTSDKYNFLSSDERYVILHSINDR